MTVKTGGARFDPSDYPVYFLAGYDQSSLADIHRFNLLATNDIMTNDDMLVTLLEAGNNVLLDSGIFWLTNRHKREHPGMGMNEALSLPPEEIDGFDELWDRYVHLVRTYESDLWGYVELDQGGAENKRRTRQRLHDLGFNPIPVYHPLNDGWEYFDEIFSGYDRVCFGNIVQASGPVRKRLLATLWERRRQYPDVWVHVLGLTPNEITTVYPVTSSDSSSWGYAIRYGTQNTPWGGHSMANLFSKHTTSFSYNPELGRHDPGGYNNAAPFFAGSGVFLQATIRRQVADLRGVFGDDVLLPNFDPAEEAIKR